MKITEDLFVKIFGDYSKSIYATAYSYLNSYDDANDICQDTFIRLLKCGDEFNDMAHIRAWLMRVCINLCKNHIRDNKSHANVELDDTIPYFDKTEENELLQVVMSLPEKYRVPLHLFYYEDYQISEIARILDMNESSVKSRLKRGKEQLRKKLGKEKDYV